MALLYRVELHEGEKRTPSGNNEGIRHVSGRGSLAEAAADEPENGVYLVARTYGGGRVLALDRHFDRLERSAASASGASWVVPRDELRRAVAALHRVIQQRVADAHDAEPAPSPGAKPSGVPSARHATTEIRFRITMVLDDPVWYRVTAERAEEVPEQLRRDGVVCMVHRGVVRSDAAVKSTAWMHGRRRLEDGVDVAVYEHLLARDDGTILEGSTSNFYAVYGNTLRTAGDGVLEGIARSIVLNVVKAMNEDLTLALEAPTIADLRAGTITEAFITSATRGVVPVKEIYEAPGAAVGNGSDTATAGHGPRHVLGAPGAWTHRIARAYDAWLTSHVEPLVSGSG